MFKKLYKEANNEIAVNKELMEHLKHEAKTKNQRKNTVIYNYGYVAAAIIIVAVSLNVFSDIEKEIKPEEKEIKYTLDVEQESIPKTRMIAETTSENAAYQESVLEGRKEEKNALAEKKTNTKQQSENKKDADVADTEKIKIASATGANDKEENAFNEAAVCEESYSKEEEYSKELLDLQERIGTAIKNGELPFVTSSSITENPPRICVVVTTKDEVLIEKVKAFDKTNSLIFIEYSKNIQQKEITEE